MLSDNAYHANLLRKGCLTDSVNTIVLEESSLEIVPKKYWHTRCCKDVQVRFGVMPQFQMLDDNFHHEIVNKLENPQKRGRPDIVHFALLDITSTPLYMNDKIQVVIHTIGEQTIKVGKHVRVPRTLQRFCGVISKVLTERQVQSEKNHFELKKNQSIKELLSSLSVDETILLSSKGIPADFSILTKETNSKKQSTAWVVGGFAHGNFKESSRNLFDRIVSISDSSLPAHVVTARLCYELERILNV